MKIIVDDAIMDIKSSIGTAVGAQAVDLVWIRVVHKLERRMWTSVRKETSDILRKPLKCKIK